MLTPYDKREVLAGWQRHGKALTSLSIIKQASSW
jgi:hypothetical protein